MFKLATMGVFIPDGGGGEKFEKEKPYDFRPSGRILCISTIFHKIHPPPAARTWGVLFYFFCSGLFPVIDLEELRNSAIPLLYLSRARAKNDFLITASRRLRAFIPSAAVVFSFLKIELFSVLFVIISLLIFSYFDYGAAGRYSISFCSNRLITYCCYIFSNNFFFYSFRSRLIYIITTTRKQTV